jgi:Ca2+-binding RTX toxin-like protein
MFGDPGNDKLFGGEGDDSMEGEEGTDVMKGGPGSDYIDALSNERFATDAPDVVDCGDGHDTAVVLPNDIVRNNCEDVFNGVPIDEEGLLSAAASKRADNAEEQRLMERFQEKLQEKRGN